MRKFEPGNVCSTPGVNAKLEDAGFMRFMIVSLNRHINGDWGNMCDEDKAANEEALVDGLRLMSVYKRMDHPDDTIWIITEADRSTTTILLPSEYCYFGGTNYVSYYWNHCIYRGCCIVSVECLEHYQLGDCHYH